MTREEFHLLADAWGADISRWPDDLQKAAAIFAQAGEAKAILTEARQLDQLIFGARPKVSEERAGQATSRVTGIICTTAVSADRRMALSSKFGLPSWSVLAASLVCAAILGTCLGVVKPLSAFRAPTHRTVPTMILGPGSIDPAWCCNGN